jgi:Mrp family chromosome partitioning ATPase
MSDTSAFPSPPPSPAGGQRPRRPALSLWLAARTRNALQRRRRFALLALFVFAAVLASFVFAPAGARGAWVRVRATTLDWRDTTTLIQRQRSATTRVREADSLLAAARGAQDLTRVANAQSALTPVQVQRRDSLAAQIATFDELLARAEQAPLPETYRAIGESPLVRREPRVSQLLDSLAAIEREREAIGGGVGVDPVFVELTTRANAIGRQIAAIAEARRTDAQRALGAIAPTAARSSATPQADTMTAVRLRQSRARDLALVDRLLADARRANAALLAAETERRRGTQLAPVPVLVVAAAIIGFAVAFALTLLDEFRSPRIADAAEVERLTGARVVATIRPREIPLDRRRRSVDRMVPPVLDPTSDDYRLLALHVSVHLPADGIVAVVAEQPVLASVVAANLAAMFANEPRETLLVDAMLDDECVAQVLGIHSGPGLGAVIENRRRWSEVLSQIATGRDEAMDVLPSGRPRGLPGRAEAEVLIREVERSARRYDVTVVVIPPNAAYRLRPGRAILLCAQLQRTRGRRLARLAAGMRDEGAEIMGVVLWDGDAPARHTRRRDKGPGAAPNEPVDEDTAPFAAPYV